MTTKERLLQWFQTRTWVRAVLIERAKNSVDRLKGISWPSSEAHPQKEVFFGRLLDVLQTEVTRDETISVLRAWAETYPGDSDYLKMLADGLRQQQGRGADLESTAGSYPPPVPADQAIGPTHGQKHAQREHAFPRTGGVKQASFIAAAIHHPTTVFSEKVQRRSTFFDRFLRFTRERDIVFALGGAGSGLDTFVRQFRDYLTDNHVHNTSAADLDYDNYCRILKSRQAVARARAEKKPVQGTDHLELKCLLTALAHAAYVALRERSPDAIDNEVVGTYVQDPVGFADYYFATGKSGAMYRGDPVPIVRHFFALVQRLAVVSNLNDLVVFMPWPKLSACFREEAGPNCKLLARVFWRALGAFVTTPRRRSRIPYVSTMRAAPPLGRYDRVCQVVCCTEVPYAHNAHVKALAANYIWPIPALGMDEIKELLGHIAPNLATDVAAESVREWTGGAPWFVRLLLSYLSANRHRMGSVGQGCEGFIRACAEAAIGVLESGGEGIHGPLADFIRRQETKVQVSLGKGHSTDSEIEEKWAGPLDEVGEGYDMEPYRLEAFVGSGLTWLRGDPWDASRTDYVFAKYPTVFLQRASRLALALYRSVTGRNVHLTPF